MKTLPHISVQITVVLQPTEYRWGTSSPGVLLIETVLSEPPLTIRHQQVAAGTSASQMGTPGGEADVKTPLGKLLLLNNSSKSTATVIKRAKKKRVQKSTVNRSVGRILALLSNILSASSRCRVKRCHYF